jgi:hypothetical protein
VGDVQAVDGRPDWLTVALGHAAALDAAGELRIDGLARALADAGIAVLAFELEGARLSDAFLAVVDGD